MKIKSISFEKYKAFSENQTMRLKPITVLIGKNSSGKSSIAKLFTLLENSLMGNIDEPLLLKNNGVELGVEFDNLFFENNSGGITLIFKIVFQNDVEIEVGLLKKIYLNDYGLDIFQWKYKDDVIEFELELTDNGYLDAISKKMYECEFKEFIPTKFIYKNTTENIYEKFKIDKIEAENCGGIGVMLLQWDLEQS